MTHSLRPAVGVKGRLLTPAGRKIFFAPDGHDENGP